MVSDFDGLGCDGHGREFLVDRFLYFEVLLQLLTEFLVLLSQPVAILLQAFDNIQKFLCSQLTVFIGPTGGIHSGRVLLLGSARFYFVIGPQFEVLLFVNPALLAQVE